jgi:hypothetical protein
MEIGLDVSPRVKWRWLGGEINNADLNGDRG